MNLKKRVVFLCIAFLFFTLFSLSGCYINRRIEAVMNQEGERIITYDGKEYRYEIEIYQDCADAVYFANYEDRILIGQAGNFGCAGLPVYFSTKDKERKLIHYHVIGGAFYYLEVGVELPDIFASDISALFLQNEMYDSLVQAQREYVSIDSGKKFFDLIEEVPQEIEGQIKYACFLELEGFEFLKVGQFYVCESNNILYLRVNEEKFGIGDEAKYYEIKDEYQEAFKIAMERLEAREEISAE